MLTKENQLAQADPKASPTDKMSVTLRVSDSSSSSSAERGLSLLSRLASCFCPIGVLCLLPAQIA